jgi:hypothetical protein
LLKRLWDKAKSYLDYVDLAVAAALGLTFTVLGLINKAQGDALAQAAIALLALLAFSVLRDRVARERVEETLAEVKTELAGAVRSVRDSLDEMSNDSPYHTRWLRLEYDLLAPDGSFALAIKTKEVRFTRNNVVSIYEHHKPDGTVDEHRIMGGTKEHKIELPRVRSMRDIRGRPIELVSLEHPRQRGEIMEIVGTRKLRDCFTGRREYVNLDVEDPLDEVTFQVNWPQETPPKGITLVRSGGRHRPGQSKEEVIPLSRLEMRSDNRKTLVHVVSDPEEGESITLFWEWEPRPSAHRSSP